MPVLDWARTDLFHEWEDGSSSLYFDKVKFAYFEIYILEREGAEKDYSPEILSKVEELKKTVTEDDRRELIDSVIVKTQGFVNDSFKGDISKPVELFKELLAKYNGIDKDQLRANLKYFLDSVMPVAIEAGIHLCIHPDDPPMAVLGLPRIVTNEEDVQWILDAVDVPNNGFTFCAGSLSSGLHNDVPAMARRFAARTHFVHLRSTDVSPNGNFLEASHLEGRGHLIELVRIFEKENPALPMRVDHGKLMLDDVDRPHNPGYSFLGRMYALAQVSGMIATVQNEMQGKG
jgi:mannonate dehydratase